MRAAVCFAVLMASSASALGAGYDDFTRGIQANTAGKNELAISSFTGALNAGDLAAPYVPDAYYGRALAYTRTSNCVAGLADVNAALKAKPDLFEAHLLRVRLDDCLGNDEAQANDIAAALQIKPNVVLFVARAMIKWRKGDFPGSSEDFLSAAKLQRSDTALYLWSAAALMHAGTYEGSAFAKSSSDVLTHNWPRPLFDLYFGKTAPDTVLAAAVEDDDGSRVFRICEADFFIAEWHLWRKERDLAKTKLREAAGCRGAYFLRRAAMYDFAQLN